MALTIGIIGLPQSGKTSLFNALTKAGAPIEGYASSTVQANLAMVQVPDARLQPLAEIFNPKKTTYTTVEVVEIAGMGQTGKEKQEERKGLSAEFLGHIRNADALAIVLRTFSNSNVPSINDEINPMRDLESLNAELVLTDLASVEKRIDPSTGRLDSLGETNLTPSNPPPTDAAMPTGVVSTGSRPPASGPGRRARDA